MNKLFETYWLSKRIKATNKTKTLLEHCSNFCIMSIPLSLLGKQLESSQGFEFELILKTLRSDQYADQNLLKSDLSIFVSKVLKMLKSEDNHYSVWKACHVVNVLCSYNPVVLCSYAGVFLETVFLQLEKLDYLKTLALPYGKELYKTLIMTLDTLMGLARGKPSLTRESLTPKLSAIITLLINLLPNQPALCLPVIKKIILKNNTTFRPFVNKCHNIIKYFITEKLNSFDLQTQKLVCDVFAYLHLFKLTNYKNNDADKDANKQHQKQNPAFQWNEGVHNILCEFKPILELMGQLLDFDQQTSDLLKKLPSLAKTNNDTEASNDTGSQVKEENEYLKFSALKLDLNEPMTLWEINQRVDILCKLLQSFLSLSTPFQIRLPLNSIMNISQVFLSLNTTFLSLQKGLRRDEEVTSVIKLALPQLQFKGIVLLETCIKNYEGSCMGFSTTILHTLQQFIPYHPNAKKRIDAHACVALRKEFVTIFSIITIFFQKYVGKTHEDEVEIMTKFVDVAMILLENDNSLPNKFVKTIETKHQISKQNKKQIKKQNSLMGSLSDLYSHSYQFVKYSPDYMFDIVNGFLSDVLKVCKLPSTQQVKIINYAVTNSVQYKNSHSFQELLKTLVVYPGNERVSILPIGATILRNDEYMKLLCAPKLPSNYVQHYNLKRLGSSSLLAAEQQADENEKDEDDAIGSSNKDELDEVAMIITDQQNDQEKANIEEKDSVQPVSQLLQFAEENILKRKVENQDIDEKPEESESVSSKKSKVEETITTLAVEDEGSVQEESIAVAETGVQIAPTGNTQIAETSNGSDSDADSDFEIPEIDIS